MYVKNFALYFSGSVTSLYDFYKGFVVMYNFDPHTTTFLNLKFQLYIIVANLHVFPPVFSIGLVDMKYKFSS